MMLQRQVSTQRVQWKRCKRSPSTQWLTFQLGNGDTDPQFVNKVVDTPFVVYCEGAETRAKNSAPATLFNVSETQYHLPQQKSVHLIQVARDLNRIPGYSFRMMP